MPYNSKGAQPGRSFTRLRAFFSYAVLGLHTKRGTTTPHHKL